MIYGLSESDYSTLTNLVIDPLKRLQVRVYVFGSRAKGTNHPFSDIDLLLVPSTNSSLSVASLSQIKETIEESRFPIKVDFVLLEDLAESYREHVLLEKIEI